MTVLAMKSWVHNWKRNGWRTVQGEVKNRDLFERLDSLVHSRSGATTFTHVRGHNGIYGNEMADKLANLGVMKHK